MKTIYDHENELGPMGVYHLMQIVKEPWWMAAHAENSSGRLRIITTRR
jgi:hypothetical protein